MKILGADGRELKLFVAHEREMPSDLNDIDWIDHQYMPSGTPKNELIIGFVPYMDEPRGGWSNVKGPLWLEGEVDDGEGWPTKFKIRIEQTKRS
jgi:hypothetical protein